MSTTQYPLGRYAEAVDIPRMEQSLGEKDIKGEIVAIEARLVHISYTGRGKAVSLQENIQG